MKKVIVVSKTHLDLGFTDYAENIRQKYINEFIPQAIELADTVNSEDKKNFVWTTGSWIIKEGLLYSNEKQKENLVRAIKNGDIVAHALPLTVHSELLDYDTFDYGLSIIDEIDAIRGKKTVSAKMTDVPGHTKAIVPLLAKHGIKLLHIGVNGVSAMPEVPECFLWKCGECEIVVVYSGHYGGAFKSPLIDEVLYFDHTVDNRGAPSPERVQAKLDEIQKEFPDYEVTAGTLDEFAECIWKVRGKLPVIENEIGDTWIHGGASDPYKSASLRELMRLKRQWLADGSMSRTSEEYRLFSDYLLCLGEHTCGMDSKIGLADYENYLKSDFNLARKLDKVERKCSSPEYPYTDPCTTNEASSDNSYSRIERSWAEQREYIEKALSVLSSKHKLQAEAALKRLLPDAPENAVGKEYSSPLRFAGNEIEINSYGGIERLSLHGKEVIRKNCSPAVEYRSYSDKDYDFWFTHYSRNMYENRAWGYADFGRPLLDRHSGKYPVGSFYYTAEKITVIEESNCFKAVCCLKCDKSLCESLGAPRDFRITYTLSEDKLHIDASWYEKDANRLTEAIFLHLYPTGEKLTLTKLGEEIDPENVVSFGGRKLHAVENFTVKSGDVCFKFTAHHSPLISLGKGKILEYDNKIEDFRTDGVAYVLYDNVWGTNFLLWYENNARFEFEVTTEEN